MRLSFLQKVGSEKSVCDLQNFILAVLQVNFYRLANLKRRVGRLKEYSFLVHRCSLEAFEGYWPFIVVHNLPFFLFVVRVILLVVWWSLCFLNFSLQIEKHVNALVFNDTSNGAGAGMSETIDFLFQISEVANMSV